MGPTALLPLRRKAYWEFFRPEKSWWLRPGLNLQTWVLKGSTLPLDHRSHWHCLTYIRILFVKPLHNWNFSCVSEFESLHISDTHTHPHAHSLTLSLCLSLYHTKFPAGYSELSAEKIAHFSCWLWLKCRKCCKTFLGNSCNSGLSHQLRKIFSKWLHTSAFV